MIHLYGIILLVLVVGAGYKFITGVIDENAELRTSVSQLERDKIQLEGQIKLKEAMEATENERREIATNRRIDTAIQAKEEEQRVTTERLANVSANRAEAVERLAHRAIENNVGVIGCFSDLRTASDEATDCGTVR